MANKFFNSLLGSSSPPVTFLDGFSMTNSAIYDLQKRRTAYAGSAVRAALAADSGATTLDIGFLPDGTFDMATYSAFGTGSERIVTWYDQSGNGSHLTRAWSGTLCPIVRTSSYNSNPCVYFNGGSLGNAGFNDWDGLADANFYFIGKPQGGLNGWLFDDDNDERWGSANGAVAAASTHFAPEGFNAYSTFNQTARQAGYSYRFQYDGGAATNALKGRMFVNGTEFVRAGGSGTIGTTLTAQTGLYLNGTAAATNALHQEYFGFYFLGYALTGGEETTVQSGIDYYYFPFASTAQLICLGDSLTVSLGATAGQTYPEVTESLLEASTGKTWNLKAVSTTAEAGAQVNRVSDINITDPSGAGETTLYIDLNYSSSVVVCWCGTNNLAAGASAATALTDIGTLIPRLAALNPTVVLVPNIIARADSGLPVDFETQRTTFNAGLAAAIGSSGVVVDLASIPALSDPNNTTYFNSFKVHLTDAGYAVVAAAIAAAIEANI